MNVLVNEAEPGTADRAIELLESSGHRVFRCHQRDAAPFPCDGLRPGATCPLHKPGLDVAVTVRAHPRSRPSLLEDGIACALRARVPVVVAGHTLLNPYEDLGVEGEHVVGAVEQAAIAPSPGHSAVATAALRAAVEGDDREMAATVTRSRAGLRATLEALPTVDPAALRAAVPRVVAALRRYDGAARLIDVDIAASQAPPEPREDGADDRGDRFRRET